MKTKLFLIIQTFLLIPLFSQLNPDVYYRFDASGTGTDTLVEDVFGTYNAVLQKNVAWAPSAGKYGGAVYLNGSTEIDLAPADITHIFNQGYKKKTVAFWFKADNPSADGMLYYDGPGNHNMGLRLLKGKLEGVVVAGDNAASPTSKLIQVNYSSSDWSHVALVFDKGILNMFLNGALAATGNLGKDTVIRLQQKQARLGYKTSGWSPFRESGISASAIYNFSGYIDEFMLIMDALDSTAIAEVMAGDTTSTVPAKADNPLASPVKYNEIALSWEDLATNEAGYEIIYHTGDGNYKSAAILKPDATFYSHKGLSGSTQYFYKIVGFNLVGSDSTNEFSATTPPPPPPPATPSNLIVQVVNFRQIDLSWFDNATNEEAYYVLCKINEGEFELLTTLPSDSNSFAHKNLDPEYNYTYKVFAWNGGGSSDTLSSSTVSTPAQPVVEGIGYPYDAGVINVKDHGVVGDGITDDTEAIQHILNNYTGIIYFPEGIYLLSNRLEWVAPYRGVTFQGQGKDKSILKLKDNCIGYQDALAPKGVIWTGLKPADRFRNYIRDLTVNTGNGNKGAMGLEFIANNAGGVINVTILSEDGSGVAGIKMGDQTGPCLLKNLYIKGFETGINASGEVNSITFEHITLEGQEKYGLTNNNQILSIRKLKSINSVPAVINNGSNGIIILLDSDLTGGAGSETAVINNAGTLFIKNVSVAGYGKSIDNNEGNRVDVDDLYIDEYTSHAYYSLFDVKEKILGLPVKETPAVQWDTDFHDWVSVQKYGAVPNDGLDDTKAIQAAIDAGKTTVYFPKGEYNADSTIFIRGNVRRIIGCESRVIIPERTEPTFVLKDGNYDTVIMEQFSHFGYNFHYTVGNESSRTFVISNMTACSGKMTGEGDVFIEDVVSNIESQWVFNNQNVWARQLNIESREGTTHLVNNGGNVWILGYKTEQLGVHVENIGGGNLEVLGFFLYTVGDDQPGPIFVNTNSNLSFVLGESHFTPQPPRLPYPYDSLVLDTQNGVMALLSNTMVPKRGIGSEIPVYVSRILPETPTNLAGLHDEGKNVYLSWQDNSTDETGFVIERKQDDESFAVIDSVQADSVSYTDSTWVTGSTYSYRVRAYNENAYSHYSNTILLTDLSSISEIYTGGIVIYPNPARSEINIEVAGDEIMKVSLHGTGGTLIRSYDTNGLRCIKINIEYLSPAVYYLSITSKNGVLNSKFLKK